MRVLIIGGGIVGLTIAREFQNAGETDVTIIQKEKPESTASFAAAGMLAPQAESDSADTFFDFCSKARDFYTSFSDEVETESGIEIELDKSGTLYAAFTNDEALELERRFNWQREAGLNVERLSALETHRLEPFISPDSIGSLFFPDDWQVENRFLLRALSKIVKLNGAKIISSASLSSLVAPSGTIKKVKTDDGSEYDSDLIILATGAWTSLIETDRTRLKIPRVVPVKGQMLSYRTAKRLITRVIYSARGYVVPRKDGRLLAGATVEEVGFETSTTNQGLLELERNAVEIVPSLVNLEADDHWSGLRPCAADQLPVIGRIEGSENLYVSTGHYRNGILLAPLSARILVDSILNNTRSGFLDHFSPDRFSTIAANC